MVFSFLISGNDLHASSTLSYGDLAYGIEHIALCGECVLFSLLFHYSFRYTEYAAGNQAPFFRAVLDALNPIAKLKAIIRLPVTLMTCCLGRRARSNRTKTYDGTHLEPVGSAYQPQFPRPQPQQQQYSQYYGSQANPLQPPPRYMAPPAEYDQWNRSDSARLAPSNEGSIDSRERERREIF